MGIARTIVRLPALVIILIATVLLGLSAWSLLNFGEKHAQRLLDLILDQYDAYVPEITVKNGQASIRQPQPYQIDIGTKDVIIMIDTREGNQGEALNYLKDVVTGAVLTRDSLVTKNQGRIQVLPLKDVPDIVLNSATLRDLKEEYFPLIVKIGAVAAITYELFAKCFEIFMFALIAYLTARLMKGAISYGLSLKVAVASLIIPVLFEIISLSVETRIPGTFFIYFIIYAGLVVLITWDYVRSSRYDAPFMPTETY
jgi:hypothetical protein